MSGSIYRRYKRELVAARDGWKCHYCDKKLHSGIATLDHVVPLAKGGGWHDDNLRLACAKCNHKKADRAPHEFHAALMMGAA